MILFRGLDARRSAREREVGPAVQAALTEAQETLRREAAMIARDPAVVDGAVKGDWATLARGASPRLVALTLDRVADLLLVVDAAGAALVQVPATPRLPDAVVAGLASGGPVRVVESRAWVVAVAPIQTPGRAVGSVVVGRRFAALATPLRALPAHPGLVALAGDHAVGTTVPAAPGEGWSAALTAGAITIAGERWHVSSLGRVGEVELVLLRAAAADDLERRRLAVWLVGSFAAAVVGLAGGAWVIGAGAAAREAARARGRGLEVLSRVVQAMAGANDPPSVLTAALDAVRSVADMDVGAVSRLSADGGVLELVVHVGLHPADVERVRRRPLPGGTIGEAIGAGRATVLHPVALVDAAVRDRAVAAGHRTQLSLPLIVEGRPWGVMALYCAEHRAFSAQELRLLEAVAGHVGLAITRVLLLAETHQRSLRLEALVGLTRSLILTRSVDEVLQRVVEAAVEIFGSSVSRLWLLDEDGEHLTLRASAGMAVMAPDVTRMRLGEGLTGLVAATRAPLVVADTVGDPRTRNVARMRAEGIRSSAGVPMLLGDRLVGTLWVSLRQPHEYSTEELAVLQSMAGQAAVAVETARLFARERSGRALAETLAEIERALGAELDRARVLSLAVERAGELFHADGVIYLQEDEGTLVPRARTPAAFVDPQVCLDDAVVGRCAAERRAVIVNDYPASPDARPEWAAGGCRRLIAYPLLAHERTLGVVSLSRSGDDAPPFTTDDVGTLERFVQSAVGALENARLYEEASRSRDRVRVLEEVNRLISSSLEMDAVLRNIADAVARFLDTPYSSIWVLDETAGRLRRSVTHGPETFRTLPADLPLGQGLVGWSVEHRQPVVAAEIGKDPRVAEPERLLAAGFRYVAAYPIQLGDRMLGGFVVMGPTMPLATPETESLVRSLAAQAAVALDHARLFGEAQERLRETTTLVAVGQMLSQPDTLASRLRRVAREIGRALSADMVGAHTMTADGQRFELVAGYHVPPELLDGFRSRPMTLADLPGVAAAGRDGRAFAAPDALGDTRVRGPAIDWLPPHALLFAPATLGGEMVGGLFLVWWGTRREFRPAEIRLAEGVAGQMALAIENARLVKQTEDRLRETEALLSVSRAVSSTLELEAVLRHFLRSVIDTTGADSAGVWLVRDDPEWLEPVVGYRVPRETLPLFIGSRISLVKDAFYAEAAATKRPVVSTVGAQDPRLPETFRSIPHRTQLFVPIVAKDRVIGGFAVVWWERVRELLPGELALMEGVASQAAVAVENARLFQQNRRQVEELSVLHELSRAVTGQLDRDALVEAVRSRVARVMDARHMALAVRSEEGSDELVLHLRDGEIDGVRYALRGVGLLSVVLATGRPLRTDDYVGECARRGVPVYEPARRFRHWLGMPLNAAGEVLGVIVVRSDDRPFTDADERILGNIAGLAALAFGNAKLFAASTRAYAELAATQEQLVRTQKLRALGEMASGVAHDFNNLLAAILGRAQLLIRHLRDARLRQWAEVIERSALDGAQTVRRLQEFTHVRRDEPRVAVDLNAVVRGALELTEARWREEPPRHGITIDVQTHLGELPPVAGDPAELREVMTNLILNALDAMPNGGSLVIATEASGDDVRLTVADTGVGMTPEVRERIFDPFFTTKGPQGTGLGLSTSYGILSWHGAEITVDTEEGRGSTFRITLPRMRGPVVEPAAPPPPPESAASLRCLVVDDEADVAAVIGDVLETGGHRVSVVADGATALARLRAEGFDAVFTDLAMLGMSGWEVADAIRAVDATLPVFMITGFGVEVSDDERRRHGLTAVFAKPLDIDMILTTLAQLAMPRGRNGGETA